ncbi:MAG: hypothetical protein DRJ01_09705 [Bacteroidetes bacterium]|nr:MAG: hypothetical protein DRJ01_09705 [Bacteroidota bacterium]
MTKKIKFKAKKTIPELAENVNTTAITLDKTSNELKREIIKEFKGKLDTGTYIVNFGSNKNAAYPFLIQIDNLGNVVFVASCPYVIGMNNTGNYSVINISSKTIREI